MKGQLAGVGVLSVVLVAVTLAVVSTAGATRTGQLCPAFTVSKLKVQGETVGTGFTCASYKSWVTKLMADKVKVAAGDIPLTNGPKGLHCFATSETKKGYVSGGLCYKGTLAYPVSGFTWNGS